MIGTGILKGMGVTARNFIGSFYDKERLTTIQYPEERAPLPENYRNFPFLVHDGDDAHAGLRCVACQICEKECPPQCIYIVKSKDKKPDALGKPQFYPATFDIDISVCMSCQICVEVCPFEAIKMDKVYELSRRERFDALLMKKGELARSNDYYHQIHPTEAAAVDANLAAAAAAAAAKKKPAAGAAAPAAKPQASAATTPTPTASADSAPPAPASPSTAAAGADPRTPAALDLAPASAAPTDPAATAATSPASAAAPPQPPAAEPAE